jgi:ectoine hydroxylase-related dioxygenase (phytanoyl-CoA dioxygenase family)
MRAMRTQGVLEFRENADRADHFAEDVREIGFTVLPDVLDAAGVAEARERIDATYERQVEEFGGVERLELINDADIARCPLEYDDYFVEMAAQPAVREVVERLLGDYFVLHAQNAIINRPRDDQYFQHAWHRDLQYRHLTSSRPLGISALYCIDDFSAATGCTLMLPASHRSESFPSTEFVERHAVLAEAAAGSVLLFDSMIFHRAGENSSGRPRRAVNQIFTLPLIQQQISLPDALGGRFADDPRLRRLLGYEAPPGTSTMDWRTRKLAGLEGSYDAPASAARSRS